MSGSSGQVTWRWHSYFVPHLPALVPLQLMVGWSADGSPRSHPGGDRGLQEGHQPQEDEPGSGSLQGRPGQTLCPQLCPQGTADAPVVVDWWAGWRLKSHGVKRKTYFNDLLREWLRRRMFHCRMCSSYSRTCCVTTHFTRWSDCPSHVSWHPPWTLTDRQQW